MAICRLHQYVAVAITIFFFVVVIAEAWPKPRDTTRHYNGRRLLEDSVRLKVDNTNQLLLWRKKRAIVVTTTQVTSKTYSPSAANVFKHIPREYIVVVVIAMEIAQFNANRRAEFVTGIAAALKVPTRDVILYKIMESDVIVEFYVLKQPAVQHESRENLSKVLYPAADIVKRLTPRVLKTYLSEFKVTDVHVKYKYNNGPKEHEITIWNQYWFIGAMIGTAACLILFGIFLIIAFWRRSRRKKAGQIDHEKHPPLLIAGPQSTGSTEATLVQPRWSDPQTIDGGWLYIPGIHQSQHLYSRRKRPQPLNLSDVRSPTLKPMTPSPPKEEIFQTRSRILNRQQLQKALENVSGIHAEFAEIPMNFCDRRVSGSGSKNRHKSILPNLTTRVKLPELPDAPYSSYINANFVKGYANDRNAFIATQGPLPNTISDFWRMMWSQKSSIIVMITKNKCEYYWPNPEQGCVEYGELKISLESTTDRDGYIISELKLENKKSSESPRTVYHFWYTCWPDQGAPDSAKQLLHLVREVRDNKEFSDGPIVVHCSAGIGRTGCFIAISIGTIQYEKEDLVDILNIVSTMREDRGGLVQTLEQYEFVYRAMYLFIQENDENMSRSYSPGEAISWN